MPSAEVFMKNGKIHTDQAGWDAITKATTPAKGAPSPFGTPIVLCSPEEMTALRDEMRQLEAKYGKRAVYGPECTLP